MVIKIIQIAGKGQNQINLVNREIEAQSSLKHPNIARLFEVHRFPDFVALVIEYCENGDVIDRVPFLDEDTARKWFIQLISGMYV